MDKALTKAFFKNMTKNSIEQKTQCKVLSKEFFRTCILKFLLPYTCAQTNDIHLFRFPTKYELFMLHIHIISILYLMYCNIFSTIIVHLCVYLCT